MGKLEFSDLRIQPLGPDSAFVRGAWHLTMTDGKTPHGLFTLIFRKVLRRLEDRARPHVSRGIRQKVRPTEMDPHSTPLSAPALSRPRADCRRTSSTTPPRTIPSNSSG